MLHESLVERVCRATQHCRAALSAGYTTYRDLGTEGAFDADVHVRDSINRGIIPGPRIFCATEALASSGGYEIRVENRIGGLDVPRISDPCDGVDGVRAGVRRRIGAGADVVKFYGDYRKRALRFPASNWSGCLWRVCEHFSISFRVEDPQNIAKHVLITTISNSQPFLPSSISCHLS